MLSNIWFFWRFKTHFLIDLCELWYLYFIMDSTTEVKTLFILVNGFHTIVRIWYIDGYSVFLVTFIHEIMSNLVLKHAIDYNLCYIVWYNGSSHYIVYYTKLQLHSSKDLAGVFSNFPTKEIKLLVPNFAMFILLFDSWVFKQRAYNEIRLVL